VPLGNDEYGYMVQFREVFYSYYSCNFKVKDGIVLTKNKVISGVGLSSLVLRPFLAYCTSPR
jgi:hypothetical protein